MILGAPDEGTPYHSMRFPPLVENPRFWQGIGLMKTPTANHWSSTLIPAERFQQIEVLLQDSSVIRAIWTGSKWWGGNREVKPCAWRPLQETRSQVAC